VLDVWEGEPAPDPELIRATTLGTPHIAGYSFDGKVAGTTMLYAAACAFLGRSAAWAARRDEPPAPVVIDPARPLEATLPDLVPRSYDIRRDDAGLRRLLQLSLPERGPAFDRLRAEYPRRLEFRNIRVTVPPGGEDLRSVLATLGFSVVP
jgi:erythronate-4-phosphate dehydrogenase